MSRFSPGEMLLGAYLRLTGKRHLLSLLQSLKHAGRPAEVSFPAELVEQGVSLVLAGLNNTIAVQSNPSWVWPHWVERQIDPDSEAFLPTGTGVLKNNLTSRNWVSLGVDGSRREAMIDPAGMITPRPYGWSWFPYLRADGVGHFPPRMSGTRQELLEGTLPVLRTLHHARPDLEWTSECLAIKAPDGAEWLLCTHALRNLSERPLEVAFGLALRPYNPLMFSPLRALRHESSLGGALLRVDGKPALLLPEPPSRVTLSNRRRGDALLHPAPGRDARIDSLSGMLSGSAEYDWTLAPGETRTLHSAGVIAPGAAGSAVVPSARALRALRDAAVERLRKAETRGMSVEIPHAGLEKAFRAVKGRLHVFDDGDYFSPGTFLYHGHWFRDAAYIALAFDQVGLGERVASKMDALLRRRDRSGFFRSQNGEWDSNGQALWTLVGHVQRGGDPALLERAWGGLRSGADWIDRKRRATRGSNDPHAGLLPAGFSAEHFGPNDHYFWDNFWSLAGLEKLLWAARFLGRDAEAARLAERIADYRADVEAAARAAFVRMGGEGLPASPYRGMDSAAVGNLVGISPLGVAHPGVEWASGTVEFLARNNLRDGLFLQKIIHTGLNPYLSAQLARALLLRQDPRAFGILEALLRHGGPAHAWPEAIHPRTGGGCMGDGDHGWAAAEFLNLIRDFLVREEDGALLLLSGAPAGWFRAGSALGVDGAPTLHGTLSYRVTVTENALSVEWDCRRLPHQDPAGIILCLPLALGRSLRAKGRAYGPHLRVRLPEDSGRLLFEASADADAPYALTGRISHD